VILTLTRHERPIYFYGLLSATLVLASAAVGVPVLVEYLGSGMVPRFPSLIVAAFLLMIACLYSMVGLIIDAMRKSRHEASRLSYMRHPAVRGTYVSDPLPDRESLAHVEASPITPLAQAG
jgi:hypothetical protein